VETHVHPRRQAAHTASVEACTDDIEKAKLMLSFGQQEQQIAQRPAGDLDSYQTEDYTELHEDVAAFLCALRANVYRPAPAPPPEPEPQPWDVDVAGVEEEGLAALCEAAGVEVVEGMSPEEMRAALEHAYRRSADEAALSAARAVSRSAPTCTRFVGAHCGEAG
jgi:hypothetical protein